MMLKYTMQHNNTYFLCKNVVAGVQLEETLPTVRYMSLAALKSEPLMMSIHTHTHT
jgi:hypothetical protein